jgi:hypothetical protein
MNIKTIPVLTFLSVVTAGTAMAGVTAEEAKQLGTTLTPVGAETAGNADGSIPAYTGGVAAMKSLPNSGDSGPLKDPFADEKPLVQITQQNLSQYSQSVAPGVAELMHRYPTFVLNVYPTHRTASFPEWFHKDTLQNAQTAHLVGEVTGDGVEGAYGGVPFPIPKNGYEVLWNSYLVAMMPYQMHRIESYMVDSSGSVTNLGDISCTWVQPYQDNSKTALPGSTFQVLLSQYHSPVTQAGTTYLFNYSANQSQKADTTWFYTTGQRRVRLAPEFKYDTPVASYGGVINFDEIELLTGRFDLYDFKLVGKKEMYVPYNEYRLDDGTQTPSTMLGKQHMNPEVLRWEKHRVWIVDGTLKPGMRHVASRRTFYIDEDSWLLLSEESYDQAGKLYRVGFHHPYSVYGSVTWPYGGAYNFYDLSKGNYMIGGVNGATAHLFERSYTLPNMSLFTPEAMAGKGIQ